MFAEDIRNVSRGIFVEYATEYIPNLFVEYCSE